MASYFWEVSWLIALVTSDRQLNMRISHGTMRIFFLPVPDDSVLSPSVFVVVCAEMLDENKRINGRKNKIRFENRFIDVGKRFILLLSCNCNAAFPSTSSGSDGLTKFAGKT